MEKQKVFIPVDSIEGNKLIAEFMKLWKGVGCYGYGNNYYGFDNLKYHSSWDWLMPVVEKINKHLKLLTKPLTVTKAEIFINKIHNAICEVDIRKAFNEIIDAIKWYNQQSESLGVWNAKI